MQKAPVERRLAAIIAIDTANYSRLMGEDELGTHRMLKSHRAELVDPTVASHHGRLVRSTGDGVLLEFASVVDAIACAIAIQRGMVERNAAVPEDRRIIFRVGINIGDIIIDGGDIFGEGVNVAARLEALCEPGGICISRSANEQIRDKLSLSFADLGEHVVKNIARAVGVFGLSARDIASLPAIPIGQPPAVHGAMSRRTSPGFLTFILASAMVLLSWSIWRLDGVRSDGPPPDDERTLATALERTIPNASGEYRDGQVRSFLKARSHRAFAVAPRAGKSWWTSDWPSAALAEERALERCQLAHDEPCSIIAIDGSVLPPTADGSWPIRDAPRLRYSGRFASELIPLLRPADATRIDIANYSTMLGPKAIALHASGALHIVAGGASQHAVEEQALRGCNDDPIRRRAGGPCHLYAVESRVILPLRSTIPITPAPPPASPAVGGASPTTASDPTPRSLLLDALRKIVPEQTPSALERLVSDYRNSPGHKAIATAPPSGNWRAFGLQSASAAAERALEGCQVRYGQPCVLVAIDDGIQAPPSDGNWQRHAMARVTHEGLFDPQQIPGVTDALRNRADVADYRAKPLPKAAALHPLGRMFVSSQSPSQRAAEEEALSQCNATVQQGGTAGSCLLYAVGDQVVLPKRALEPLTSEQPAVPAPPK